VVVWKRVGRRWHLHRDIWNGGPLAGAESSAEPTATPEPTEQSPEPMDASPEPGEPSPTGEDPT
jgi:hypothetical protein